MVLTSVYVLCSRHCGAGPVQVEEGAAEDAVLLARCSYIKSTVVCWLVVVVGYRRSQYCTKRAETVF